MIYTKLINLLLTLGLFIFPLILGIAFLTLFERKILSTMQCRRGPNIVGFGGFLQPIADGLKLLFLKETVIPYRSNKILFLASPIIIFLVSVLTWLCIPLTPGTALLNIDVSVLYFLALSSLSIYGIIISGWASNSN